MPSEAPYEIDDAKSVDENLSAFVEQLKANDPKLGAILAGKLSDLSLGKKVSAEDLLESLYLATKSDEGVAK